jgi:cytidylate kinase
MIITIDGPAGSGKSTAAKALARRLGLRFLDTGAMYRAITLRALKLGLDLASEPALARCAAQADLHLDYEEGNLKVRLDGQDVTDDIRRPEVTDQSHFIAAAPGVRAVLVRLQRQIAQELGGVVSEGRDQGSVVFPDADVKFYLVAQPQERARRRYEELRAAGQEVRYEDILEAITTRDRRDRQRAVGPLVKPAGAIEVDNTHLAPQETAALMAAQIEMMQATSYSNPHLRGWRLPPSVAPTPHLYRFFRRLFQVVFAAVWQTRIFNRRYEPTTGPVVYICNHQSFLDPILMSMALRRPMNYMARDTLFRVPGFGRLIWALNAFPVHRGTADTGALKEALRRVQAGGQVVVFAEGTRTRDGRIGSLLPGVALLARRARAITVPVVVDGAFECWPRWQPLPLPGHIVVQYGRPILAEEAGQMSADEFVARVRGDLIALQAALRRRLGRPPLEYGNSADREEN